jgi:azurin
MVMTMARLVRVTFWAVAAVLFFGGVTLATGQGSEVRSIELEVGDNMRFTPSVIEARPGERLHVVIKGVGKTAVAHNFVVLKSGTIAKRFIDQTSEATKETGEIPAGARDRVIAATPLVRSGNTAEVTFDAPSERGEYPFVCTFPGHFNLGMRGQLTVK